MTTPKAPTAEERAVQIEKAARSLLPDTWPTGGIYGYALSQIRAEAVAERERVLEWAADQIPEYDSKWLKPLADRIRRGPEAAIREGGGE
jgi:hypothetical protein